VEEGNERELPFVFSIDGGDQMKIFVDIDREVKGVPAWTTRFPTSELMLL
jgi:hypothetical protein